MDAYRLERERAIPVQRSWGQMGSTFTAKSFLWIADHPGLMQQNAVRRPHYQVLISQMREASAYSHFPPFLTPVPCSLSFSLSLPHWLKTPRLWHESALIGGMEWEFFHSLKSGSEEREIKAYHCISHHSSHPDLHHVLSPLRSRTGSAVGLSPSCVCVCTRVHVCVYCKWQYQPVFHRMRCVWLIQNRVSHE